MANKVLALLMVVAVAGVALGSLWLSAPGSADASGHSATRSFSSSSVAPGETVTVTIVARELREPGQDRRDRACRVYDVRWRPDRHV